ncbi:hypothetical protein ACJ5NV_08845 [Loktanella agnita]|uniref:hypothetical protein n=1 Tax=Loktanella agnita TaxID=287097 RepID=UPI00398869E6
MPLANYTVGSPSRPAITHDNGFLDQFAPRAATFADRASYTYWHGKLEAAEAAQDVPLLPHNDIPDALAAYRHFLEGTGTTRTFSYERYVSNDSSGATMLRNAIIEAKSAASALYSGLPTPGSTSFDFTGTALTVRANSVEFPYPATENWQKAIGAHVFWISGSVSVTHVSPDQPAFDLTFTIHAEDQYNFNPGQADIATGIPDSANGVFEVTGLAQGYRNEATLTRRVQWTGPTPTGTHTVTDAPTRRQRPPNNNRRIRNLM